MSYRIAGTDVHKKMLAVVMSEVEIESEYQFERRMFGSSPEQLRSLATRLLEQSAILETSVGSIGTVLETAAREAGRRMPYIGNAASGKSQSNRGRQENPSCLLRPRILRCRGTSEPNGIFG